MAINKLTGVVDARAALRFKIREVLMKHCTGQDDHDFPFNKCRKCLDMEAELVKAINEWLGVLLS